MAAWEAAGAWVGAEAGAAAGVAAARAEPRGESAPSRSNGLPERGGGDEEERRVFRGRARGDDGGLKSELLRENERTGQHVITKEFTK